MSQREHFSLTASTAASVTITARDDITTTNSAVAIYETETHRIYRYLTALTVINHSDADTVYYRMDGSAAAVAADDCWALPAGTSRTHGVRADSLTVSLISTGTPAVSVEGES